MRRTRLVILPGARCLTQMCCLLLYLSCPNIGALCREQLDISREDLYLRTIREVYGNTALSKEGDDMCYIKESRISCGNKYTGTRGHDKNTTSFDPVNMETDLHITGCYSQEENVGHTTGLPHTQLYEDSKFLKTYNRGERNQDTTRRDFRTEKFSRLTSDVRRVTRESIRSNSVVNMRSDIRTENLNRLTSRKISPDNRITRESTRFRSTGNNRSGSDANNRMSRSDVLSRQIRKTLNENRLQRLHDRQLNKMQAREMNNRLVSDSRTNLEKRTLASESYNRRETTTIGARRSVEFNNVVRFNSPKPDQRQGRFERLNSERDDRRRSRERRDATDLLVRNQRDLRDNGRRDIRKLTLDNRASRNSPEPTVRREFQEYRRTRSEREDRSDRRLTQRNSRDLNDNYQKTDERISRESVSRGTSNDDVVRRNSRQNFGARFNRNNIGDKNRASFNRRMSDQSYTREVPRRSSNREILRERNIRDNVNDVVSKRVTRDDRDTSYLKTVNSVDRLNRYQLTPSRNSQEPRETRISAYSNSRRSSNERVERRLMDDRRNKINVLGQENRGTEKLNTGMLIYTPDNKSDSLTQTADDKEGLAETDVAIHIRDNRHSSRRRENIRRVTPNRERDQRINNNRENDRRSRERDNVDRIRRFVREERTERRLNTDLRVERRADDRRDRNHANTNVLSQKNVRSVTPFSSPYENMKVNSDDRDVRRVLGKRSLKLNSKTQTENLEGRRRRDSRRVTLERSSDRESNENYLGFRSVRDSRIRRSLSDSDLRRNRYTSRHVNEERATSYNDRRIGQMKTSDESRSSNQIISDVRRNIMEIEPRSRRLSSFNQATRRYQAVDRISKEKYRENRIFGTQMSFSRFGGEKSTARRESEIRIIDTGMKRSTEDFRRTQTQRLDNRRATVQSRSRLTNERSEIRLVRDSSRLMRREVYADRRMDRISVTERRNNEFRDMKRENRKSNDIISSVQRLDRIHQLDRRQYGDTNRNVLVYTTPFVTRRTDERKTNFDASSRRDFERTRMTEARILKNNNIDNRIKSYSIRDERIAFKMERFLSPSSDVRRNIKSRDRSEMRVVPSNRNSLYNNYRLSSTTTRSMQQNIAGKQERRLTYRTMSVLPDTRNTKEADGLDTVAMLSTLKEETGSHNLSTQIQMAHPPIPHDPLTPGNKYFNKKSDNAELNAVLPEANLFNLHSNVKENSMFAYILDTISTAWTVTMKEETKAAIIGSTAFILLTSNVK